MIGHTSIGLNDGVFHYIFESRARDNIDKQLHATGWAVQDKDKIDWNASIGIAVREYQTDVGPADYVLFVERRPVGIIESKKEEEGHRLTAHEPQAESYAKSNLKYRLWDNITRPTHSMPQNTLTNMLSRKYARSGTAFADRHCKSSG